MIWIKTLRKLLWSWLDLPMVLSKISINMPTISLYRSRITTPNMIYYMMNGEIPVGQILKGNPMCVIIMWMAILAFYKHKRMQMVSAYLMLMMIMAASPVLARMEKQQCLNTNICKIMVWESQIIQMALRCYLQIIPIKSMISTQINRFFQ